MRRNGNGGGRRWVAVTLEERYAATGRVWVRLSRIWRRCGRLRPGGWGRSGALGRGPRRSRRGQGAWNGFLGRKGEGGDCP